MKKQGAPRCTMMRCRMMMTAQMQPTDPAALLAIKDELQLSDEQTAKLVTIVEKARKEAQAVLIESQQQKVQALGDTPRTMMQMCRKMRGAMRGQKGIGPSMCSRMKAQAVPTDPNANDPNK